MKKLYLTPFSFVFFCFAHADAQTAKIITGFHHVESVAVADGFLYAADIGVALKPSAKDGDGQIIKMDKAGTIIDAQFVKTKLNAPKGLAIYKGILYLTDIDRVLGIDIATGTVSYEIDFSKDASFLNDIAVWDEHTLFVSATDKSKLFRLDLVEKTYAEVKTSVSIPGINGLFCKKRSDRLYVNGFGSENKPNGIVGYISLKDNHFTKIDVPEGYYDGLALNNGILYTSDWVAFEAKGVVREMATNNFNKVKKTTFSLQIPGPADFVISGSEMFVPAMLSGEIYIFSIY
ncbi:hypothetical protein [Flavobacterium sp.]|uniref:hypothetical protein n=1 Tax=Flavobacterium sp. TaxID=239 RepID=UPI002634ADA0|nr:hypothetical protein [Flavobacterium sp.]